MSKHFAFPVKRELTFSDRCVSCGKPKEESMEMRISRQVTQKQRQINKSVTLLVPLCMRCKQADQRVLLGSLLSFCLGLVIVGVGCFILLMRWETKTQILNQLGMDNLAGQPGAVLTFIGLLSIMIGFAGGFLVEIVAKVVFIPFLGRVLYHAPILAIQFFGDIEYVAGLQSSLSKDATTLRLTFFNAEVAGDFARLNPTELYEANSRQ